MIHRRKITKQVSLGNTSNFQSHKGHQHFKSPTVKNLWVNLVLPRLNSTPPSLSLPLIFQNTYYHPTTLLKCVNIQIPNEFFNSHQLLRLSSDFIFYSVHSNGQFHCQKVRRILVTGQELTKMSEYSRQWQLSSSKAWARNALLNWKCGNLWCSLRALVRAFASKAR